VLFADSDQLVWASSGPLGACVEAYSAWGTGVQEPLSRSEEGVNGARVWDLAASAESDALFAVLYVPSAAVPEVRLSCFPAPGAADSVGTEPLWTVTSPAALTGAARVASDAQGERVCFAAWDTVQKRTFVRWHRALDGVIVAATEVTAGDLDHLVMSADGEVTLATEGDRVWVWDSNGALIHYEATGDEVRVADLDSSGERLLLAHGPRARLLSRVAGGFLEVERVDGEGAELAACGALAEAGSGWAVSWCDLITSDVRFALYEGFSSVLLAEHQQAGRRHGRQNTPQAVSITPDGSRAAFATWGDEDHEELLLLDASAGGLSWAIDLPGSATDVAIDRTGRRIAVSHKDVHANDPGAGGCVRLFDTGEADLALTEAPLVGGSLSAECEAEGASVAFFLFGAPLDAPMGLPFVSGDLWVSLHSRILVRARRPGEDGRARCELSLPQRAAGVEVAVQAVKRCAGQLVATQDHLVIRVR